jgi:hypothetical protein
VGGVVGFFFGFQMETRPRRGAAQKWLFAGQKHLRHIKAGDRLKIKSSSAIAMEWKNGI